MSEPDYSFSGSDVLFLTFLAAIAGLAAGFGVGACQQQSMDWNAATQVGVAEYACTDDGDCGFRWIEKEQP